MARSGLAPPQLSGKEGLTSPLQSHAYSPLGLQDRPATPPPPRLTPRLGAPRHVKSPRLEIPASTADHHPLVYVRHPAQTGVLRRDARPRAAPRPQGTHSLIRSAPRPAKRRSPEAARLLCTRAPTASPPRALPHHPRPPMMDLRDLKGQPAGPNIPRPPAGQRTAGARPRGSDRANIMRNELNGPRPAPSARLPFHKNPANTRPAPHAPLDAA
ncbi:early nodulin-11-like [Penaeus chinensis]|uniref:early nodulin-11-like n=1 Tax=Penaeus chinensis TaxID=139456 RepID=UPI001FB66833|nr:early nodulin-11-like [Penaeus chinensis]